MTYDLHIVKRFLTGYVLLILGLIVFFVVLHYVEYVDDFMDRGATMSSVFFLYYPNYVPDIIRLISPLAVFISAVFLTSRLAQKLELSSLQTAGVSLYRILVPFVIVGVVITGFMFWFNGWVVPQTNRTRMAFEQEYTKDARVGAEYANIHRQNAPGSILSVNYYERRSKSASVVSLQLFNSDGTMLERIDAERMTWIDSLETWRMTSATVRRFDESGEISRRLVSVIDTVLSIFPRDLSRLRGDVDAMTITEARSYLNTLQRTAASRTGRALVAYYSKFSYPFANLILILLAVPLASVRRRGGQAVQLGLSLFIAFVYLALIKLVEPFGYTETISPVMAAWIPHIVFMAFAVVLLIKVRK